MADTSSAKASSQLASHGHLTTPKSRFRRVRIPGDPDRFINSPIKSEPLSGHRVIPTVQNGVRSRHFYRRCLKIVCTGTLVLE
jgi:hypothetical protein